jgi:hypothetical protein
MFSIYRPSPAARGVTLIEVATVIGISSILALLIISGLSSLRDESSRRAYGAVLISDLQLAKRLAVARQRAQIIVIDAAGAGGNFGYYHFEDSAAPPNIYSSTDLSTIMGALDPSDPSTAPSPYSLRRVDAVSTTKNPFVLSATAWGGTLPFPFSAVGQNTSAGCTFCTAGRGAVAFVADGRVRFSDGNVIGGMVAFVGARQGAAGSTTAVGVSTTGFAESYVR